MTGRISEHSATRYSHGGCRCEECRADFAAQRAIVMARKTGETPRAAEVVEWARGLGFDLHPTLKGRAADALVVRYNREHPERPYVRIGGAR